MLIAEAVTMHAPMARPAREQRAAVRVEQPGATISAWTCKRILTIAVVVVPATLWASNVPVLMARASTGNALVVVEAGQARVHRARPYAHSVAAKEAFVAIVALIYLSWKASLPNVARTVFALTLQPEITAA
jgi:hypothetical protein